MPVSKLTLGALGALLVINVCLAAENTFLTTSSTSVGAAQLASMEALDDAHQLGVGDRLSFRIVEDQEDPKPLIVTDSGDLEVPYLGRFAAAGKTCKQLARALKGELEKELYYQATVIIAVDQLSRNRGKVYLVGSVRNPGPQEIPGDEIFTLSKAIMRAGGFGDFADRKRVKVTRKGDVLSSPSKSMVVNVADIIERGHIQKDLQLQPGDLIFIPDRLVNF
jgi:polysaccharide export outer membrane protein